MQVIEINGQFLCTVDLVKVNKQIVMMKKADVEENVSLRENKFSQSYFLIVFNVTSLTILIILVALLEKNVFPSHRSGFYCNDNSIRYPYKHDQTVSGKGMFGINFGLSIVIFLIGETCFSHQNHYEDKSKRNLTKPDQRWYIRVIKLLFSLTWCMTATLLITAIIKSTVGSLRPHFIAVCNPDIDCFENSTSVYHLNYTCQANLSYEDQKTINEARRSFPSGHSSFSAAVMTFNIIYIQLRYRIFKFQIECNGNISSPDFDASTTYFRLLMQISSIGITSFIAMSRVKDYYHHLVDVLVGFTIGVLIGYLVSKHSMKWLEHMETPLRLKTSIDEENAIGDEALQEMKSLKETD